MLTDLYLLMAETEPEGIWAVGSQVLLWLRVALGIGLVIFVHELGHFVAAKTFGVKCEKFYVGFDPPMKIGPIKLPSSLGKFTYGETEYGIGIIPLGGYVKMLGQDDDPRRMREEAERARRLAATAETPDEDDEIEFGGLGSAPGQLDSRSLPAKPVWQRMIIMSAGVFMNLVTGAMFAAIAFFYGVPYTPTIVGSVMPGGPAWKADVEPGGQVITVAGMSDPQMRFRDMKSEVLHSGLEDSEQSLPVTLIYGDEKVRYELPMVSVPGEKNHRLIGVQMANRAEFRKKSCAIPMSVAADVLTDDDAGSKVISYAGIAIDDELDVPSLPMLDYIFRHPDQPIEFVLRRADQSEHTVTVPPQASNWIGIRTVPGPITALVMGGPAERAGMKQNDVIESVDGLESLSTASLLDRLADGGKVTLTLRRGEATETITITPDDSLQTTAPIDSYQRFAAMNAYGFAFEITASVAGFDRANLVSGDALMPDDELQSVILMPDNEFSEKYEEEPFSELIEQLSEPWKMEGNDTSWGFFESIQTLPKGTQFKVFAKRKGTGKIVESVVKISTDSDYHRFDRGLLFEPYSSTRIANSFGEAISLGIRESRTRLGDVGRFLLMAVKGRIAADMVGGPVRIFQVAGYEAERGISAQLLFLTMLSMNLAILNFLPIPVLDGGHMVFLTYEFITGRRVNEEIEMRLTLAGGLMLLALMVFVFFNDIINITT